MAGIERAVVSVSDKRGVVELCRGLRGLGTRIVSTGGTARVLEEAGVEVVPIREVTGNAEDAYFSGRMKTISFRFEAALLFDRQNEDHRREAASLGIEPIDLVVCNLYPFEATVARPDCTLAQAVEEIDIGGPCMVRAGAKNWRSVAVVTSPDQYDELLAELERGDGTLGDGYRLRLARRAFATTAAYDTAVASYLEGTEA